MPCLLDGGVYPLDLARRPVVERVERVYTGWGQEIAAVTFAGAERGLLAESGDVIARFFERL